MKLKRSDLKQHSGKRVSLVLVENEKIEASVEKAAGDLTLANAYLKEDVMPPQVMQTLANEMAERAVVEFELAVTKSDLAEARDDLLNAQLNVKEAQEAALHDALTGLPNRVSYEQGLAQGLTQAIRHGWRLAVLFIDVDNFKSINDSHGHGLGDQVLVTMAARLRSFFRDEDIICRWGGDEFVCLLMEVQKDDTLVRLANDLYERISETCTLDGVNLVLEVSIGIAIFPEDGASADTLIRNADSAMYAAKGSKTRVVPFRELDERSGG